MNSIDLTTLVLKHGNHRTPEQGACLIEAASMLTDGEFGDNPPCVSPVIRAYGIALNDNLPDDLRQHLVPFVPLVLNTASTPEVDDARRALALDWLIRVYLPAHLDLVPALAEQAALVRALPELKTPADVDAMLPTLSGVRGVSASVRASVWASVWASVRDSVWASVRDSVWASVRASVAHTLSETPLTPDRVNELLNPLALRIHEESLSLYRRMIAVTA